MDARVKPAHDAFDKLFKLRPAAFAGTNGYWAPQLAPNARLPYDAGDGLT